MQRIALTDGSGAWFDASKAVKFKEDTRWDGRNHISVATGSQWEHQWLYYTKNGKWVLHRFSDWQGATETYEIVEQETAVKWLIQNAHVGGETYNSLPDDVRQAADAAVAAVEI